MLESTPEMTFAHLENQNPNQQMQPQAHQFQRYQNTLLPYQQQSSEKQPENEISQGQLEL